jgi:hypothetical protein
MTRFADLIIADGTLLSYCRQGPDLVLDFQDYYGTKYELSLHDCSEFVENDALGFSLNRAELKTLPSGLQLEFFDDDELVLHARFQRYSIRELPDRDTRG